MVRLPASCWALLMCKRSRVRQRRPAAPAGSEQEKIGDGDVLGSPGSFTATGAAVWLDRSCMN